MKASLKEVLEVAEAMQRDALAALRVFGQIVNGDGIRG